MHSLPQLFCCLLSFCIKKYNQDNKGAPNWISIYLFIYFIYFFFTAKLNYSADRMKGGRLWKFRGVIKKIKKRTPPFGLKCESRSVSFSPNPILNYSVILVILYTTMYLIILFNTNALGSRKRVSQEVLQL